jgi:hypothetical protein
MEVFHEMKIMPINLNNPGGFTLNDVRKLLAAQDDSVDRQLRITQDGWAVITNYDGSKDRDLYHCRCETWDAGNGYVGVKAAQDDVWVERIFNALKANWPKRTGLVFEL